MNIAVIFAGGVGKRMKNFGGIPKQFLEIEGIPVLIHTIKNFEENQFIDAIVVVMLKDYIENTKELLVQYQISKVKKIVEGGSTGQESIYHGLLAAKEISGRKSIVLIHDGVRPIIEDDLIEKNIKSVLENGSAISSVPSKETIIRLNQDNRIEEVIDRSEVWIARAPQSFFLDEILAAHQQALADNEHEIIDSCTMMTKYGKKLCAVETCPENLKITTPEDFYVAEGLIRGKKNNG